MQLISVFTFPKACRIYDHVFYIVQQLGVTIVDTS